MQNKDYMSQLTSREVEVLQLLADGKSNQQIARELSMMLRTVKFHTNNIYAKLDVGTRAQAIAWIWKNHVYRNLSQD